MTNKEENFFNQTQWYHGTTYSDWKSICKSKIIADYNAGISLDFGSGFYLSPNENDTIQYALNTVKYNGSNEIEDCIPVVIEFEYYPMNDIANGNSYKYFANYNNEFAEFVFNCRNNTYQGKCHNYNITGGVMTDTVPTKIMQQYLAGIVTKEFVLESFKKSTSKKQLCLHSQELCDKLIVKRAYIINGKELDVNEYYK